MHLTLDFISVAVENIRSLSISDGCVKFTQARMVEDILRNIMYWKYLSEVPFKWLSFTVCTCLFSGSVPDSVIVAVANRSIIDKRSISRS